jgi:hypothetical protein
MVDLPAPVGPVIAKIPLEMNSGVEKSITHSPYREFKFLNRSSNIFIVVAYSA